MIPLKVLLPLALLVVTTLAAFPSSNQIRLYGKENSNENIDQLGNPAPDNGNIPETPEVPGDKKKPSDDGTVSGSQNPADENKSNGKEKPGKNETGNGSQNPAGENKSNGKEGSGTVNDKEGTKPEDPKLPAYRLPDNIKPTSYDIQLTVNHKELPKKDSKFDGLVDIHFLVEKETNVIKLHYDRNSIKLIERKLVEVGTKTNITVTENKVENTDISSFELPAGKKLEAKKNYILTLKYEGKVNDNSQGFYKGSYINAEGERRWYVVTHFEPLGARSAFPCFDEPAMKAEFSISITHDKEYTAITNMPFIDKSDVGKTMKKVIFQTTPRMSTYLVAFAITDFETTGKKAKVYSRPNAVEMAEFAATTGEEVLKELEDYTGIKYDLPKMDQIALPLLRPGAMENWGLVTYRETALLYDEKINATIDQQKVASIIAHEFAHQWFGNLVSPKWWSYIWLNEGFATYFQYYIADKINPNWRFMDQFNVASLQGRAFVYDADWAKTRPMDNEESNEKEISDMFDDVAYHKAGAVIRMFVHALGEDNFQKGIKSYLKNNKGGVATPAELYKALDEAVTKGTLPDGFDVAKLFGDWATKKGYPVVTVTKNKKTKVITAEQQPFYFEEPLNNTKVTWYIPLNYVHQSDEYNFEDTSVQEWLTEDKAKLSQKIDKDGWIIFNKQQTGYYRVNYDKENWEAIALYLKSENFTMIHYLNRAQLIDDALNLARAGLLSYDVALDILDYLPQETDYIVWKSAFAALENLKTLLAATEHYYEFSKFLVTVTDSLMQYLTYTPKADELYNTTLLRVDAIKWACDAGSEACKEYAAQQVDEWLSNPYNNATLPRDLQKVILCGALKNATLDEWNRVYVKYATSTNTEERELILSALGCSMSSEILNKLLDLAVQPASVFTGHILEVFQSVYSNSAVGVQLTLDFILKNIDKLSIYDAEFYDNLEKYIKELGNRVVLDDDVTKLREIVTKEVIPLEKTQEAVVAAERNVKWFKKNGKNIGAWFKTYNDPAVTELPVVTTTKGNGAGSLSFTALLLAAPLVLARLR